MGSLMSGWSCQTHDPKKAKYMRNKSMTRADIDAYWKTKKNTEDQDQNQEHKSVSSLSSSSNSLPTTPSTITSSSCSACVFLSDHHDNTNNANYEARVESRKVYRRSSSMPSDHTSPKGSFSPDHRRYLDDNVSSKEKSCWWMASNWAFLNEPPVLINEPPQQPRRSPYNYTTVG